MKSKRLISPVIAFAMIMLSVFAFTACSGKSEPVKVTVLDCGKSYSADGTDDMTVGQLLEKAEIDVSDRDTVDPKLDARWCDAGAHAITIKRFAKVKIIAGDTQKEVELIGGTVDLAISQAGFSGTMYDSDVDKREYLRDGMEIHLTTRKDGFVSEGKKAYYLSGGALQKNGIVGSDSDGFYYADENGQIDLGYCDGVNFNGADWNVIEGKATKVESDSDKTDSPDKPDKPEDPNNILYGDVNSDGRVTAKDALMVQRYAIKLVSLTPEQWKAADVDIDNKVSGKDALNILRFVINLVVLPIVKN